MRVRIEGWLVGGMAAIGWAAFCVAQEAGGVEGERLSFSLREAFEKGGWTMYPLLFLSVLTVAFILYLIVVLRSEMVVPRLFSKEVAGRLYKADWEGVRQACRLKPNPLGEVILAGLDALEADPRLPADSLKEAMQSEGERQALAISSPTQYLLDIAVIAPMLGLFGTVLGMMKAFQVVALDLAKARPMLLAAGVSEALITTAFGLLIGIPAMAAYAFFRARAARLIARLESASGEIFNLMLKKRGG